MFKYHSDADYEILNRLNNEDLYHACYMDKRSLQICEQYPNLKNKLTQYSQGLITARKNILRYINFNFGSIYIYFNHSIPYNRLVDIVENHGGALTGTCNDFMSYKTVPDNIYNSIKNIVYDLGYEFNPHQLRLDTRSYSVNLVYEV